MPSELALFDAHFHVIDPRFPLIENQGYLPAQFSCADYLAAMKGYRLIGGAVVSGSFQGFDQAYLQAALAQLGAGFVGVTQLPPAVPDQRIVELDRLGVRALRFNLRRGDAQALGHFDRLARRAHELAGWHAEFYVDAAALEELAAQIGALPAASIDHLGLSRAGLPTLLKLVEKGVRVKASGFGRVDFDPAPVLQALFRANPEALMFGTDLPSTRAPRPYRAEDFQRVIDALGEQGAARVLAGNALQFYRLPPRVEERV